MTLRFHTSSYAYRGEHRVDVTREGVDRARAAGKPVPGAPFAPSGAILWPAKNHLALAAALERRAVTIPSTEAAAWLLITADKLVEKVEAAYARLYLAELRVSAGLRRGSSSWNADEERAWQRGLRSNRPAWDELLARESAVLVCFCRRREPGPGQRWTCHRHRLAAALVAFGAVDQGEIELPEPRHPRPHVEVPVEHLVAVTGTRPPGPDADAEERALYRRICADVDVTIAALPPDAVVVHGGAEGVDKVAGAAARRKRLAEIVYRPWYDAFGHPAPMIRNVYVGTAPRTLAWPGPKSRGTWSAMKDAEAAGSALEPHKLW